jgi:coatomer subunit beta'
VSESSLRVVKFIPNRHQFVCGGNDKSIYVYDLETFSLVKLIQWVHADHIRGFCFNNTGEFLLSCSDDQDIVFTNVSTWKKHRTITHAHSHYILCIQHNPFNVQQFFTGSYDASVKVWQFETSKPLKTLNHSGPVTDIKFFEKKCGRKLFITVSGLDHVSATVFDAITFSNLHVISTSKRYEIVCSTILHNHSIIAILSHNNYCAIASRVDLFDLNTFERFSNIIEFESLDRGWDINAKGDILCIGFDHGICILRTRIANNLNFNLYNCKAYYDVYFLVT